MPLTIIHGDIARFQADALVNAANSRLQQGAGVCGALFEGAGSEQMQAACDAIGFCPPGSAVITPAFHLSASHVIHAVGPVYQDGTRGEGEVLKSAYTSALKLAQEQGLRSIAFPLISAGTYGYPREEALSVAISAIRGFLDQQEEELDVSLVLYNKQGGHLSQNLRAILDRRLGQLRYERQLSETLGEPAAPDMFPCEAPSGLKQPRHIATPAAPKKKALEEAIRDIDEGFSTTLLKLITAKHKADTEVYKRANLDRKHFSKIRSNPNYTPKKKTVLALCVALELTMKETEDLLSRAGYALSPSKVSDVIIGFFIQSGRFDIDTINMALFEYDQELLGA